jgi:xanthine dehydrogenase YagR molybdenum-binding subunit
MTQIAADELGLPLHRVTFKLGDSALPKGPVSGGSQTAASVGPAVKEAAIAARHKLLHLAISDGNSPLFGASPGDILIEDGRCFTRDQPGIGETYASILRRAHLDFVEAEISTNGTTRATGAKKKSTESSEVAKNIDLELDASRHSFQSFGAQFARVLYDPALGTVRVSHCASVMDIGKVLNLKMATSQIMGGMIFGIGMALMEGTTYDETRGRIVTRDLSNYLVPVHADIPELHVQFIDRPDPHLTSIGARGVGEIGITGITAAIANAVYHASGKRIRDLPITPDKLV